jgi:TolC family type I secretion outer membrane protein
VGVFRKAMIGVSMVVGKSSNLKQQIWGSVGTALVLIALLSGCASKKSDNCAASASDLCSSTMGLQAQAIAEGLINPLDVKGDDSNEQAEIDALVISAKDKLHTGSISKSKSKPQKGRKQMMSLADITLHTLRNSPEIGIFGARTEDAYHGVRIARAGFLPSVDMKVAAGYENSGTNSTIARGVPRREGSIKVKQRVLDFGTTSNNMKRAKNLYDSSQLRLIDKADAVILDIAEAYLDVMEQSQYIANGKQNIRAHQKFYQLVKANEGEGNGTQADVERAFSRLENVRTQVIDFETARQKAIGRFRRISGIEPGKLRMPPQYTKQAQLNRADISSLLDNSPRLHSIQADSKSLRSQIKSQKATFLPAIDLQGEANARENSGGRNDAAHDYRGMVVMSWNLFSGGRKFAVKDQLQARLKENEHRYRKAYNELEEDMIEAIRTMRTTRKKAKTINDQVRASEKVAKLYTQQFSVGKKRLLEVLDAQKDLFAVRRDRISNRFERLRANYRALRLKGRLVETITGKTLLDHVDVN